MLAAAGWAAVPASGAALAVVNGGFTAGTAGWYASSPAQLALTSGRADAAAGRVTNGAAATATVALNDSVNTVGSTVAGTSYTASAWVRLTRAGSTAGIRLMEYSGSTLHGQQQGSATLSDTAWHEVRVTYTAATSGASLDLNVLGWALPAGGALDVDDVTVTSSTAAPVTPTPTPVPTPTPTPTGPAGWRLAWSDEFNSSQVDTSRWHVRNNVHNSNETSCLTNRASNVSESGGTLHITAQRERATCGGYTADYTSGYLDTIGIHSATYGRFEMRAKLPTQSGSSKGMWPAFWLRPDDGGAGEIDIMEAIGSGPGEANDHRVSQTLWYDYTGSHPRQVLSYVLPGPSMSDQFHTYAVEWERGVIRWYVDGRLTWTRDRSTTSWMDSGIYDKPYNIRLNMQVGGSWPGQPTSATALPADYRIDYVRVYSR